MSHTDDPEHLDPLGVQDPPADTAAEEDHTDPWALAGDDADPPGDDADPPGDLGRTDDTPDQPRDYPALAADAATTTGGA